MKWVEELLLSAVEGTRGLIEVYTIGHGHTNIVRLVLRLLLKFGIDQITTEINQAGCFCRYYRVLTMVYKT
jgi:hypothetical protein